MTVTTKLIKELRRRTGAGMMECKKALLEADGDVELAIEIMRKNGAAKAAKKAGRVAAEGLILVKESGCLATVLEVNCQTDFVAKGSDFRQFTSNVAEEALATRATVEELRNKFEEDCVDLVTRIGERVLIRRIRYIEGNKLASYCHGEKIGAIVSGEGDIKTLKQIAMHIAASYPDFVSPEDIPSDVMERERAIQLDIAANEGKPDGIREKVVMGRMKKFTSQVSLTGQPFVMEPKTSVGRFLKEKGANISSFVRLELGEGIDKGEDMSFAEEVFSAQKD